MAEHDTIGTCPLCGKSGVRLVKYGGVAICTPCGVSNFTERQERERKEYEGELAEYRSPWSIAWRFTNFGILGRIFGNTPGFGNVSGLRRPRWGRGKKT